MKKWSKEEVEFLRENCNYCTRKQLAIGVNPNIKKLLERKLVHLNLKNIPKNHHENNVPAPNFKNTGGFYIN